MRRTLQFLLAADIPTDLPTIEASMRAISARIHDADSIEYEMAHERLNQLLTARELARQTPRAG